MHFENKHLSLSANVVEVVLATVSYSSPASLASLTERSYEFTSPLEDLDSPARFAVT